MPVSDVDGARRGRHRGLRRDGEPVLPGRRRPARAQRGRRAGQPRGPADRLRARRPVRRAARGRPASAGRQRFGDLVVDPADSLGMAPAPPGEPPGPARLGAGDCATPSWTRRRAAGVRVAVAVVDRGGDPIQQDLMDGGPAGAVAVAQAVAGAAALFGCEQRRPRRPRSAAADAVAALVVPPVLGVPGGLPVRDGGRVVARPRRRRRRPGRLRRASPRDRPGRVMTGGDAGRSASRSSAAARSAACTPRTSRACPASRCGPSTRWAEHVDAIEARGLRVTGLRGLRRAGPRDGPTAATCRPATSASSRPRRCTRAAAVAGARAALADAAVVSVQNGLGNEEVIAELVPRVIRGSIVTAGAVVAPGVVAVRRAGRLLVRAVRAQPGADGRGRARWPGCSPRAGCAPTRSRTPGDRSGRKSFSTPRRARWPR